MKYITKFCLIIFCTLVLCCKEASNWSIAFCSEINGDECLHSKNTFDRNIKVFVILESKEPIDENLIIGNIYRMYEGNYDDYLGSKNFKIKPNTHKIKHSIPFDELGGSGPHLIEFTREDGTLIILKELFIK
jgi:hypothetical protein